jgi:hypothetical protein
MPSRLLCKGRALAQAPAKHDTLPAAGGLPGWLAAWQWVSLNPSPRADATGFPSVHQRLRMPPALKAGVADHVWTVEAIVRLAD